MSDYREMVDLLRLKPTLAQHRACLYLERHGQRFLIDFGLDNAPGLASALRGEGNTLPAVLSRLEAL